MSHQQNGSTMLHSRAYQLEMFEHSMKGNTIVVMGTGTGKTHVASLRIDAELRRTPTKQVWFTAPNAGLVDQQLRFLSSQLPEYRMKSLTGRDNVDMWGDTSVWDRALTGVNVVVATPRVLLDALHNAHLRLQNISLLVLDEAHHCQANDPSALLMQTFYHPLKARGGEEIPYVLGLTASPCISDKTASIKQLEANLDATCRSPTISIEEYGQHVHKAVLVRRYFAHVEQETSSLLRTLEEIVFTTDSQQDPCYISLLKANDDYAIQKLKKYERSGQTPAVKELRQFLGNAQHLHESLGTWASDLYIRNCVTNWHNGTLESNSYHHSRSSQHQRFIDKCLSPLRNMTRDAPNPSNAQITPKALELIQFLITEYREDIAIIVFVERRSAAWALCQLLQANPLLKGYGVFSYVGSSTVKAASLHESSTTKTQDTAFLGFRGGSRNLCIATSVAEEGIDVQAVNIVIRYDDPKQVVSYLQSRGRARQRDSRIVCFQATNGASDKYELWDKFEKAMEEQYRDEERLLLSRLEVERCEENSDEVYKVENTNALLDLNVSVSRLAHFCAKAAIPAEPIYVLEGETGVAVSARVLLPSCVPPQLREAHSCRDWRSEKMARRDAAFHAIKALHIAGLINDHLTPFEEKNASEPLVHEKKLKEVPAEHQVWTGASTETLSFAYRIEVSHMHQKYLSMTMILSTPLHHTLRFPLCESVQREIKVSITPLGQVDPSEISRAEEITEILLKAAFQTGSASNSLKDTSRLSCSVFPELKDTQLGTQAVGLQDFLTDHNWLIDLQPLLVWKATRPRPYIWYPPHTIQKNTEGESTLTAKQIRKLQIFSRVLNAGLGEENMPQGKELLLEQCEARGVATVYGPIVLLLPSILHIMAAAIRAQHAKDTVLRSIRFSSTEFVVPALIAKSASGTYNYERLEFLGDTCLKYFASVQMFFDHPAAPEGILTRRTHEIIGNTRLEEAIGDVGLAPFITTEMPAQKHWRLPKIKDDLEAEATRTVLSKTLADVVESILGAAFLDGQQDGQATEKCIATLQFFIPEVEWLAPRLHIERHRQQSLKHEEMSLLQHPVKQMLGYEFKDPALLVEALTHSTDLVWQPSLDRLEFLGDAILDQIIKVKLFEYPNLDAGRLTVCRHALASHAYLAYCALSVSHERTTQDVSVDRTGRMKPIVRMEKVELTDLIKFRTASLRDPIALAKARYDALKRNIESELKAGKFPWTLLRSLNAPKVCSDIIESLLGAVYLDTKGSLAHCQMILQRLGIMHLLERIAKSLDFEVRTPGARLRELCAEKQIAVSVKARCEQDGDAFRYIGEIDLERDVHIVREASCLEEAESLVAEAAMNFLLALGE